MGRLFGSPSAFESIDQEMDSNGILHESFALVPLGWFFFALGLVLEALSIDGAPAHSLG
ncbi:DUF3955 domain-containing protein [Pseudodesulfovibrio sp. S3]|uniref:DUF3955 domain-containing protein n=1 Tax=Pseudodesulfovibrio sp. S3-i TaxID=2929474 RepID=UPI000FEBD0C6